MLPLGKNYILDLHLPCHRTECETKARDIRIHTTVPAVHLTWCWSINGKCIPFVGNKNGFLRDNFQTFTNFLFELFESVCTGIWMIMEKKKKLRYKILKG